MTKRGNPQENKLSVFKKKTDEIECLIRSLKESENKCKQIQESYLKLCKDYSERGKKLKESEERNKELYQENEERKEVLSYVKFKEAIEKFLLKETYSFLLSEGYTYNYKKNLWQRWKESQTKDDKQ